MLVIPQHNYLRFLRKCLMIYGDSPSGLRDLSAANRHKIDAELNAQGDSELAAPGRFDEDAMGTRISGPVGARSLDEDATGTRTSGPVGASFG